MPLLDNWFAAFIVVLASGIWMSPFIGWFLFVSSYTKRSPLLMAFMPLILIALLEKIILKTHIFWEYVLGRGMDIKRFFDEQAWRATEDATSLLVHLDVAKFLTSPAMWAGIIVCGLLSTAAIYVRRYHGES